ncbi:SoxY-related AACIE arm protein [Paracraurococcus ruber]|uniref:Sulfur oxidation protein SoxY n=2 Tax=Paracraurococcus ruber TaxID=77675 RepID=A0ABS1CSP2_9PROT|nr:SoxY-related AACIE arm protein [Paracraurococcus ruber]MBK1657488.1 sulfur oxidation protein SoxY [Paracraurococcus ruber]TDG30787.1 SoxY-related AACIE arm protein [Paracraurococcus ruber]
MSSPSWPRCATDRRAMLGGLLALSLVRPAGATPEALAAAMREFTGGAAPLPGGVTLDIPPLVENGNAVPVGVEVESPMTEADHVRAIALFNERNPLPNVITARLGPWSGAARLSTRIRLATSQRLIAVAALSDGSYRMAEQQVVVTLAACIEG